MLYRSFYSWRRGRAVAVLMNCSTQACMDVCDFACGFNDCPGGTGTIFNEDVNYFAKDKGMVRDAYLEPRTNRLRARPQGTHTPQRSRQVCCSNV